MDVFVGLDDIPLGDGRLLRFHQPFNVAHEGAEHKLLDLHAQHLRVARHETV